MNSSAGALLDERLKTLTALSKTRWATFLLAALAFLVSFDYGLCRSTVETLYNQSWSGRFYLAWLASAFAMAGVVFVYNRLALRVDLWRIFRGVLVIAGGVLALGIALLHQVILRSAPNPQALQAVTFLLEIWKDLYIVLLVEIFWTFMGLTSKSGGAHWRYGFFIFLGALGDFSGNALSKAMIPWSQQHPGWFLQLFSTLFAFLMTYVVSWQLGRSLAPAGSWTKLSESIPRLRDAWNATRGSSYLLYLVFVVALSQIVMGFVDTRYAVMLGEFPKKIEQHIRSNVYLALSCGNMVFGLLAMFVLRARWVAWPLLVVPVLVFAGTTVSMGVPGIWPVATTFAVTKCFSYSLFRSAKEMLYLPLSPVEKVKGKALIDMFVYRFGKSFSAVLLLPIHLLGLGMHLSWFTLGVVVVWAALIGAVLIRYFSFVRRGAA